MLILLMLLATAFCHENRLLVAYPVASRQMEFLMRNLAVILADDGYHVTVLSTDDSKFLSHPNITSHVLEKTPDYSLPECTVHSPGSMGCNEGNNEINSGSNFWTNKFVTEVYQNRDSFGAMIVPFVYNEFCFSFIKNSNRKLIFLKPTRSMRGLNSYESVRMIDLMKESEEYDPDADADEVEFLKASVWEILTAYKSYRTFLQDEHPHEG